MTLMPVDPSVEYKSTVCCTNMLGLIAGSAISGVLSSELDSPTLDCWRPKRRLNVLEPSFFAILGTYLGARDYLTQVVEESLVLWVWHLEPRLR